MKVKAKVRKKVAAQTPKRSPAILKVLGTRPNDRDSLWKLEKHGVSQSFISKFMQCREQTRLSFCEGWTSKLPSKPREFGSCGHWILKQIYSAKTKKSREDLLHWIGEYRKLWRSLVPMPLEAQLTVQEECYMIMEALLRGYLHRYQGDWTGKYSFDNPTVKPYKWLGLEDQFKFDYEYEDGVVVPIRGMFDGVFESKQGTVWLFETKFLSRVDEEGLEDLLPHNLQVMLYLTALMQRNETAPKGVLYNVVRRPALRQKKDESMPQFVERIYQDVLQRPDHYFIRWDMTITKAELLKWRREFLDPVMKEIRNWSLGIAPHYMNPDALINKYGRSDFYELIVRNNTAVYYKRAAPFNELEEASV